MANAKLPCRENMRLQENRKLLVALNKAYSKKESEEEKEVRKQSKKHYARKIVREKW